LATKWLSPKTTTSVAARRRRRRLGGTGIVDHLLGKEDILPIQDHFASGLILLHPLEQEDEAMDGL